MVLLKAVSDPKFTVEPMDVFWVGVEMVQKSSVAVVYTKVDAPPKKVAMIDTICRAWKKSSLDDLDDLVFPTASTSLTRCPWWPYSSFYFAPFWRPQKSMGMEESCEHVDALKMIGVRLHADLNISVAETGQFESISSQPLWSSWAARRDICWSSLDIDVTKPFPRP